MDYDNKNNERIDLSGLLKDSDTGVKFEEYQAPRSYYHGTPKMIQWVIKYSGELIKDEKQASYVLIGFVAIVIIFALFLIFGGKNKNTKPTPYRGADSQYRQLPQANESYPTLNPAKGR